MALAWTATALADQPFHTVAMSADGQVIAAGSLPGALSVSRDGGATWAAGAGAPAGDRWISVDMSASGQYIVGVGFDGGMYLSTDSGANFARIDGSIGLATGNATQAYESVTISDDGQRIVAVIQNGGAFYSTNGGTTFNASAGVSAPSTTPWRAVDSSANGMVVVAAHHNGDVYVSSDGGANFTLLPVTVGGASVNDGWYRLALSRDGGTVALAGNQQWGAGNPVTGIYVGQLSGGTWTFNQGSAIAGNYGAITMSANGNIIAASLYAPTVAGGAPAQVLVSGNHGASFAPVTVPTGVVGNWRGLATNAAGSKLALANGDFAAAFSGQLYTSTGTVAP